MLVRAACVVAAAAGCAIALASVASADVVEPTSAFQPASMDLFTEGSGPAGVPGLADASIEAPAAAVEEEVADDEAVVATPAPEQVVRPVPAHLMDLEPVGDAPSALERVTRPLQAGFQHVGSYLGRVVSACEVGLGSGAGGPVLVLGVLSVALAFNRRRVLGSRTATDEDVPQFLYAWESTPPG